MHPALKSFIERGERELEGLEEPERSIRLAQLHNEVLRRFNPKMFTGEEELNGNPIDEPITDKDVEECIIEDHYNRVDSKTAEDMAEEGCYGDDGESESEPRLRGMMKPPFSKDFGQVFRGAPDPRTSFLKGVVDAPVAPDAVDLAGVYEERVTEKMGGISRQNDLFTRTSWRKWRTGLSNRAPVVRNYQKTCDFCGEKFLGTQNAKYCNRCKAPQFYAVRQRLKEGQIS